MNRAAAESVVPDMRPLTRFRAQTTLRRRVGKVVHRFTAGRPHLLVVAAGLLGLSIAYMAAFMIRFDFAVPERYAFLQLHTLPFVLLVQCLMFYACGVFRILWAYVGFNDLLRILRACGYSTVILLALDRFLPLPETVPHSVIVIDGIVGFLLVSGMYAGLRSLREASPRARSRTISPEAVLIVGAGDSGETLLHEIERGLARTTKVVGFLDDDPGKSGRSLRGVPVRGRVDQAAEVARNLGVRTVYIAIPSADGAAMKRIVGHLREGKLRVKVLPPVGKLSSALGLLSQLRNVSIEDLLRRKPIRLDQAAISDFIKGKVVMVTGAAGSIGSEICRQVLAFHPERLIALDCAETPLHDLLLELKAGTTEGLAHLELADVTDRSRIDALFAKHQPQVVFHAAALKHVPICESHPREALRVNVGGMVTLGEAAVRNGVEAFVIISTDKAVNPSSMMGATKRAVELIAQRFNREQTGTRFAAVRFGNVLGSNGSVLRIFKSQLSRGGPLTVTHPDMKRYFMTIPEAVQLVLQAAVLGRGGEIFELDMGSPVRIVDLAQDFIRMSGLTPGRDVKIEFTGIRPGEKLFEELYLDSECVAPTAHPQVFFLRTSDDGKTDPALKLCLERLSGLEVAGDPALDQGRREIHRLAEFPPVQTVLP
ncbi:MAG TPA: nucleoside-diphosphate sugar epimerase/dehydratase [Planctomycetota bacterium]|nr:nucleoside-diphosphate sugar epimerase/dehydratase [Planctomycetota bacterium]